MTMTLEELKRSVQSYKRQPPSWVEAIAAAIKERDELRNSMRAETETVIRAKEIIDAMSNGWRETQDELDALKQRIAIGRHVRSTRNGAVRTPVGWCEPNTDYTIITDAKPPTETP